MENEMFYGASGDLFGKARNLRKNMTLAEKLLWERLKENKLGVRFKPQHPIDIYVADFYCHELKLVIELDGEIHKKQKEDDEARTDEIMNNEIKVIRFPNYEVINEIEIIISKIKDYIAVLKDKS